MESGIPKNPVLRGLIRTLPVKKTDHDTTRGSGYREGIAHPGPCRFATHTGYIRGTGS